MQRYKIVDKNGRKLTVWTIKQERAAAMSADGRAELLDSAAVAAARLVETAKQRAKRPKPRFTCVPSPVPAATLEKRKRLAAQVKGDAMTKRMLEHLIKMGALDEMRED